MKRKIFLVRHGESADKQHGQTDFDRVLTGRGKNSIERLGKFFKQENISFSDLISSPAVRAEETVSLIARTILYSPELISFNSNLFNGSDKDYWNVIRKSGNTLLLVGHNPPISFVIGRIAGDYSISLMPAQCAMIDFDETPNGIVINAIQLIGPFH